ncbi:hypothetical protein F4561_005178 [Lipingzhangella halophila]|uniref:AraC family transcriptional regulator n=1 Tax=Lipingzhangella halophila TaxID=1783352 RepID=A0A7W7RMK9_9ACTN|nr:hypothetical protein [Lipingzhangella halophila]
MNGSHTSTFLRVVGASPARYRAEERRREPALVGA